MAMALDDMTDLSSLTLDAAATTTAWMNAFLATGQDEAKPILYRTLSIELFHNGVQFIACDGTMLFRTWVSDNGADFPETDEAPERSVVIMDSDKFALSFIKALASAVNEETPAQLTIAIEPAPVETPGLGEAFKFERVTLRALGQELHCRLFEQAFVNWRRLRFGLDPAELVDGMKIAPRLFATVGKIKGAHGVDCSFHGDSSRIEFKTDGDEVRGLLMPMRREKPKKPSAAIEDDE
jgi:hypothetical protein